MEEINKIFNRLREKTFTKKDYKGNMCNEWVDCLSYNDDIKPMKELILAEIETLKADEKLLWLVENCEEWNFNSFCRFKVVYKGKTKNVNSLSPLYCIYELYNWAKEQK